MHVKYLLISNEKYLHHNILLINDFGVYSGGREL